MPKHIHYGLTINVAKPFKKKKQFKALKTVSRKCVAVIVKNNGELQARVSKPNHIDEYYVMPLTKDSFNLSRKVHVYSTRKDKNGRNILVHRNPENSYFACGTENQFVPFIEGNVISGYIKKMDEKLYFDYDSLVAFNQHCYAVGALLQICKVKDNEPLFK